MEAHCADENDRSSRDGESRKKQGANAGFPDQGGNLSDRPIQFLVNAQKFPVRTCREFPRKGIDIALLSGAIYELGGPIEIKFPVYFPVSREF